MNDGNLGLPDKSDPNDQTIAQQPIFLPAPPEEQPYSQPQQLPPSGRWIPPQGMGRRSLPTNPAGRTNRSWRNDPAYRVLFIAIGVVLLSSLTCVAVLAAVFNQSSSQTAQRGGPNIQQTAGVNTNSPTPIVTPTPTATPTPEPTPTPAPTPTPVISKLTVEVNPNPVQNRNAASINISGSKPGATIHLVIGYTNANSFSSTNEPQDANGAGNATILWGVFVTPINPRKPVTADLKVTAEDGQGYQVTQTVTVSIITNGP